MSANDIGVGDLVMVVRPRECCGRGRTGVVFTVGAINRGGFCCDCSLRSDDVIVATSDEILGKCELSRLIKLKPRTQPERTEREAEATA